MEKNKKILLIVGVIFLISVGLLLYFLYKETTKHKFQVNFFDIGQGDSALIQFANGQQMLVDCSIDKRILAKLGQALPFYDRTIDYLLVTHPDLDHYGGCVDVLKNYTVKEIITNGYGKENDSYWHEWEKAAQNEGAIIKVIDGPENWTIASSTIEFLSPDKSLPLKVSADDSNNYSIIFRLTYASSSFLFTADMEMPLEQALLKKYCAPTSTPCPALQVNTLKVGHHGSDTSSGEDFLRAAHPQEAIISVGKDNKYGHPSRRVLNRLERANITVLRTDEVGDIQRY